ncbi:MAG: hypothetical protein AB7L84_12630 [Acidimicrobiia bacterium]
MTRTPTAPARPPRARRTGLAAGVALVMSLVALAGPAAPSAGAGQGGGNPVLQVSVTTAAADRVTDVTVTGLDYLVPPHAPGTPVFGGVYVFFGWVANPAAFGPSIKNSTSNDGTFGVTYAYPGSGGDPGTRDPGNGTMRLVSFTPNGESGEATDYHMDDQGNWTTQLRIYGSTFTYVYPVTGEQRTVDCRQVQCGVFTIGAHGKTSATNEKFTPISFAGPAAPVTIPPPVPSTPAPAPVAPSTPTTRAPSPGATTTQAPATVPATPGPTDPTGTTVPDAGTPADTTDTTADPAAAGAGSSTSTSTSLADGETRALGVSDVRSTGGGNGPLVAGVALAGVALAVGAGAVLTRRHRRRTASAAAPGGT